MTKTDVTKIKKAVKEEVNTAYQRFNETLEKLDRNVSASENRITAMLDKSEARLASDRKDAEARLAEERKASEARLAEERKESKATRRTLYANFFAAIMLIIGVFGLLLTLMNGGLPV